MTNPLTNLPPRLRLAAYTILGLAALALAAYKASEGDWVEFAVLLLGSLGFGTSASNVPSYRDVVEGDAPPPDELGQVPWNTIIGALVVVFLVVVILSLL